MTDLPPPAPARIFAPLADADRAPADRPEPVTTSPDGAHAHAAESAPDAACSGSESCC